MSDFASFAKKAKEEIQTKENHREWYLKHLRLNGGLDKKHERALGSVYDSAAAVYIKDLFSLDKLRDHHAKTNQALEPLSPLCQHGPETYNDATFPVGCDVKKELDAIGVELDENSPLQFVPNFGSSGVEKILLEKEEIPPDHKVLKSLFPLTPLNGDQYVRAVFHLKRQNVRANGNDALYSIYGIIKNNIDDFMKDERTSVTGHSVFGGYHKPINASEFASNARRFLANVITKHDTIGKDIMSHYLEKVNAERSNGIFMAMLEICWNGNEWDLLADLLLLDGTCVALSLCVIFRVLA